MSTGKDVVAQQSVRRNRAQGRSEVSEVGLALDRRTAFSYRGSIVARLDAAAKRVVDVIIALTQMVLTAPAWLLLPLAIKLEDGGRVFFRQERVGRYGERFISLKFRSMMPRREGGKAPKQAELEEHRITRVGRLMRATALDELPQLWNILVGEMSFVGPRALLPEEREARNGGEPVRLEDLPGYEERHSVRPGLTGLAQVRAPRDLPHRKKFRYDLLYVRKRTIWLDLKLIVKSVWISVRGKWPEVGREEEPTIARTATKEQAA